MGNYGDFTEEYTLRAAAAGGQPDFVYRPIDTPKGQAQREIGDCIIWVGMQALVVSVKSRDPDKMGSDTEARAKAWLDKQIDKALRQIEGTVRTLKGTSAAHSAEGEHPFRSKPNTGSAQAEHHRSEATRLLLRCLRTVRLQVNSGAPYGVLLRNDSPFRSILVAL